MAISGELSTMSLADILQWVDLSRKTGRLAIESGIHTSKIYFKEGRIITTSSTDPRSYLGQFLLSFSSVTEEQLRQAFEEQERSRVKVHGGIFLKTLLGRILVDHGFIPKDAMLRILRLKAEESIYALFLWEQGIFTFEDQIMPAHELVPIELDLKEVIHRGIERMERWNSIKTIFPSNRLGVKVLRDRMPGDLRFNLLESRVIELAENQHTPEEIACELHCFEFKVLEILYQMYRRGWVEIGEEQVRDDTLNTVPPNLKGVLDGSKIMLEDSQYEECRNAAQAILKEDPTNKEARELLTLSEKELVEDLLTGELPEAAVPSVVASPDNSQILSSPERYFLARVMTGKSDIRTLLKLSPLSNYDSLRALKRLKDRGVIQVNPKPAEAAEGAPRDSGVP